ncbi:tRNA epoxyqueuosine(34) reductase QueG [Oceanobacillus neutriphilus]|uniref:Epoxyqueuosine reductase n=1 Tax=Oceanobacillus neutriphilus TaxID=531815 RepID=A0ABQ2NT83_9BACI|nr:tRNA epoxyqueuosine(34) reductase QueG [Oceanobacillus neutriphilus]GGP09465.1 epoxyqueuosine reductase [Oceanobacillus neutriphilus]
MKVDELKKDIQAYAKTIGIDKIGFTTADIFTEMKERLRRQQELKYQSGFEKGSVEERTEPQRLLPEAKSIISIAVAYPSRMEKTPRGTKGDRRGIFARASWGIDYHTALRERLDKLGEYIKERVPDAIIKSMVDTGELSDRAVAERAGVGFSGKNTSIITKEYGSFVYLGEMLTNIPFIPDEQIEDGCGDCTICLDACPTGAIVQAGQLNAQRCIAFLTQTKDFLPEEFRTKIGNRLYGCDTCQQVCPWNKGRDSHFHKELEPDPELVKPKLKPMLHLSNREFKEKFGHMSGSWRGKKPIQRNVILALGHYKEASAEEDLIAVMKNDPRPVIRGTAAWSLGKIGTDAAREALSKALEKEDNEQVQYEMENALSAMAVK